MHLSLIETETPHRNWKKIRSRWIPESASHERLPTATSRAPEGYPRRRSSCRRALGLVRLLALSVTLALGGAAHAADTAKAKCKDSSRTVCYSDELHRTSRGEVRIPGGKAQLHVSDLNWVRYRYDLERKFDSTPDVDPLGLFPFIPKTVAAPPGDVKIMDSPPPVTVTLDPATPDQCTDGVTTAERSNPCAATLPATASSQEDSTRQALEKAQAAAGAARSFIRSSSSATEASKVEEQRNAAGTAHNKLGPIDKLDQIQKAEAHLTSKAESLFGIELGMQDLLKAKAHVRKLEELDKARTEARNHLMRLESWLADAHAKVQAKHPLEAVESCSFSNPGRSTYTLVRMDVLAEKGELGSAEKPYKREMVVFVCAPRVSVSGGVSFATLRERKYQFVAPAPAARPTVAALLPAGPLQTDPGGAGGDAAPAVPNVIAFDRNSTFRVLPMALSHARLWSRGLWGVHATFGAGAQTGGNGLDLELLAGPSISLADRFFITSGVQIGRVDSLVQGYEIGTPQPTGVSEPPIQRSYKPGLGIALSWRFSPAGSSGDKK